MKIKLCGFTEEESLRVAVENKCDFLGFIFYDKSPRFITPKRAAIISANVPPSIAKVAVVVDCDLNYLTEIAQKFSPDFFQFHGDESVDFLKKIRVEFPKIKIIKAFKILDSSSLNAVKIFEDVADIFLFDGKNSGSGEKFDWKILQNFPCKKDWFLSGGLNIDNIDEALRITNASMIDISSGIEKIRGIKSPELIRNLMTKVRKNVA